MSIPFTMYIPPDGIPKETEFEIESDPTGVEAAAHRLIAAGYRFEAEWLQNGKVWLTAASKIDGEWQDVAIEIAPNGPEVGGAVERLVASATAFMEEQDDD